MWLDRLSGHSTPSSTSPGPPNRSYSPAPPRRQSHLAPNPLPHRPGLSPRQSSLSVFTNGSTDSLPAAGKVPNGSSLRIQLNGSPAPGGPDPLDVLSNILGTHQLGGDVHDLEREVAKPASLVEDVDFDGLSLQEFVNKQEISEYEASTESFEQFEQDKDKFEDLHKSILACDEVLKSVENYLTSFQADLAAVSAEIETLQNRSTTLNTRLETRKEVEKHLGPEVEALSVSPAVVRKITDGAIDETWLKALDELEKRSKNVESKSKSGSNIKAVEDLKPLIEDLKNKAIERIRDYVVAQIKALRSPSINAQLLQQNAFLRYKDLFAFLQRHQPQLAEEISQAYIYTMRWYYLNSFTRYKTALDKLQIHTIDKNDALAQDESARRSTVLTGSRQHGAAHDAFTLSRRADTLKSTSTAALSSYHAEESKTSHYLEIPFRAFNLALVDNASAEYSFLTEFFTGQSFHAVNRKFAQIFEPTFALGQALTKQLIESTLDALGILICVRLNQYSAFELQRRKVPAMDGYINGTSMFLWPRFQIVMDQHCDSIRRATSSLPGRPAGSALSLTSSPANAQSIAPHPVTQKFANFAQGILALSSEAGDDEPVHNSLGRLRTDFEAFLTKLSKGIAEARKRERFLFNNYSLVGTIIAETEGKLAEELKAHFAELREELEDKR